MMNVRPKRLCVGARVMAKIACRSRHRSGGTGPDGDSRRAAAQPPSKSKSVQHFYGIAPTKKHVTSTSTVTPKPVVCHDKDGRKDFAVTARAASPGAVTMSCHVVAKPGQRWQPIGYELGERSGLINGSKSAPRRCRHEDSNTHEKGELTC
jgi:hypothetical protein